MFPFTKAIYCIAVLRIENGVRLRVPISGDTGLIPTNLDTDAEIANAIARLASSGAGLSIMSVPG